MYRSGLGTIDWGGIINSGIGAVSNILGQPNYPAVDPRYAPNYPGTYTQGEDEGMDVSEILSLVAVGLGAYLVVSSLTKKRR